MSGFQRMIAIPQEEYIHLTTMQSVHQPWANQMSQLNQQYEQEAVQSKNPYDRLIKQSSTLEEMKQLKEKIRNDLSLGSPKPYRNRALSLYRSLEPNLKITQRGEVVGDDGAVIRDSRVEDLINHAVRDRRRHFTPTGWEFFLKSMKKFNVPKAILGRDTLQEMENDSTPRKRKLQSVERPKKRIKQTLKTPEKLPKRIPKPSTRYPSFDFITDF